MPFSPRILRWRTLRIASLWHGSSPRYIYGLLRLRCHRDSPEQSQAIFLLPAPRHLRPPRLPPPPHHFLLHPTPPHSLPPPQPEGGRKTADYPGDPPPPHHFLLHPTPPDSIHHPKREEGQIPAIHPVTPVPPLPLLRE